MGNEPKWVVFDIDGVLADPTHRLPHIQKPEPDWDAFFGAVSQDTPREKEVEILRSLAQNFNILLLTGRSDQCMEATATWFKAHQIPWAVLYMRVKGDHREDHVVKPDRLRQFQADYEVADEDIIAIFEDRAAVVRVWREMGFTCFQNVEGDF